jgi:hypothetical protein
VLLNTPHSRMSELAQPIYDWLYRDLSLRTAGLILGGFLVSIHLYAFFNRSTLLPWLKIAPRQKTLGIVLLTVDLVMALILMSSMDLGEFWKVRKIALILLPVIYGLMILYVDEFLTARALGILMLLAACPFLDAAFLELPRSRLLLPLVAYAWIILGMFWVGMPYLLRDHINWLAASESRWKGLSIAGTVYGALVLVAAVTWWGR